MTWTWRERAENLLDLLRDQINTRRPRTPEEMGRIAFWEMDRQAYRLHHSEPLMVSDGLLEKIAADIGLRSERQVARFKRAWHEQYKETEEIRQESEYDFKGNEKVSCPQCEGYYLPHEH